MDSKFIAQLEAEAEKHERVARTIRNTVKVILESDRQEPLQLNGEGVSATDNHVKNPSAAIRAVAAKIDGKIDADIVRKMLRAEFPTFAADRDKINFVLWRMAKKGKLRIVEKGSPHNAAIYSRL